MVVAGASALLMPLWMKMALIRMRPSRAMAWLIVRPCVSGSQTPGSAGYFNPGEEERDLDGRIVRAVRAMHRVGLDVLGELGADGAGIGLLRVGRTHDLAVARDRIVALQHLRD